MDSKTYCAVSGTIFALVALLHLVRLLNGWVFQVGPFEIRIWVSYLGLIITAALSWWAFRLAMNRATPRQ